MTFDLGNYNSNETIVIDPWVISPTFTTSTAVWEVETDGIGNVYSIGGETPMERAPRFIRSHVIIYIMGGFNPLMATTFQLSRTGPHSIGTLLAC